MTKAFTIKANGVIVGNSRNWNGALSLIRLKALELARAEKTTFRLIDCRSVKEGFGHIEGHRTWKGANGTVVKFTVEMN